MATINGITNNVFDSILPTFGNPRANLPVWDESQRMFITSEYESVAGNRYYKGIRFSDRLVIVEKIGLYHTWTYIDGIELYVFDGKKHQLIGSNSFEKVFHSKDFVKGELKKMLVDYVLSQAKLHGVIIESESATERAERFLDEAYRSFLNNDVEMSLESVMPLLTVKK
ncbi:MAG: hypothetical protein ACRCZY_04450 [Phocaeicola sp.]